MSSPCCRTQPHVAISNALPLPLFLQLQQDAVEDVPLPSVDHKHPGEQQQQQRLFLQQQHMI
jgi:hypothetical protein